MIPPESNLPGVMSVTDWDFLRPPSVPMEEADHTHRPSLDEFDAEIAVFQVSSSHHSLHREEIIIIMTRDIIFLGH